MRKYLLFIGLIGISFFLMACSEEGYTKIFECAPKQKPIFSTITHDCYGSEQLRDDAEKTFIENMKKLEAANKNKPQKSEDDEDEDYDEDE